MKIKSRLKIQTRLDSFFFFCVSVFFSFTLSLLRSALSTGLLRHWHTTIVIIISIIAIVIITNAVFIEIDWQKKSLYWKPRKNPRLYFIPQNIFFVIFSFPFQSKALKNEKFYKRKKEKIKSTTMENVNKTTYWQLLKCQQTLLESHNTPSVAVVAAFMQSYNQTMSHAIRLLLKFNWKTRETWQKKKRKTKWNTVLSCNWAK